MNQIRFINLDNQHTRAKAAAGRDRRTGVLSNAGRLRYNSKGSSGVDVQLNKMTSVFYLIFLLVVLRLSPAWPVISALTFRV